MKRIILSAVAASMLALTGMQAQAAPINPLSVSGHSHVVPVAQKKVVVKKRVVVRKPTIVKKRVIVRKPAWRAGQRYSAWKRHQAIRDYNRYGLRRPGRGQEWIRVNNDYVLISIASGIIAGAIAAN